MERFRARLTLVGGDRGGVDAVSNSRDDPSDDELCEWCCVSFCGHLDYDADDHHDAAEDHAFATPEKVAGHEDENGAEEAADFVDRGHQALHCRVVFCCGEEVVEGGRGDDAGHDTRGISKLMVLSLERSYPWS